MTRFAAPVALLSATVGLLLGFVIYGGGKPPQSVVSALRHTESPPIALPDPKPAPVSSTPVIDFAAVAARVNPAVVNVDAAVRGDSRVVTGPRWRRDLTDEPGAPREGSGSGFLIDPAGYLLTNFHVVDGADRITVTLGDGRSYRAALIGIDPAIDVALLKIEAKEPVPVAVLGNSDGLRPGQWVCAIGNPLGYVHSVTVGVISFLGRKLFDPSLDSYIQTDAAISLGNSGGPLIDGDGRVVGITTAISAQAANIGFAVPISQVLPILNQLREHGRVSRGFLGIGLTDVTPALRRALSLDTERGALVQDVSADSPAERAGLRPYDVIVAVDDSPVASDDELIRSISARLPGTPAKLTVVRETERRTMVVKLVERPLPESARLRERSGDVRPATAREHGLLGLTVRDLDRATALRQRIPDIVQGVLVTDVDPAGPARLARLRAGQLILEINRRRVSSVVEYQTVMAGLKPGDVAAVMLFDPLSAQRVLVAIVLDPS